MGPSPRPLMQINPNASEAAAPFQMRGSSFTLLTLKLNDPNDPAFFERLAETLAMAPGFYRDAPIVLDLSELVRSDAVALEPFCHRLREMGLVPVGFQGATADWEQSAVAARLSVFPAGRATETERVKPRGAPLKRPAARLVSEPVRSGQQVYAAQGDLIVLSTVSRGAEVLADGHIHVYAPLRGRALAGVGGDTQARIFCRKLDAELISIAGTYAVSEQIDPALFGQSVQIRLVGEKLVFDLL